MTPSTNYLIKYEGLKSHPFNSMSGYERMKSWLEDPDEELFYEAYASAEALPYIDEPWLNELISIAVEHPNHKVRLAASWVEAKIGRQAGFKRLADYCLDVNNSYEAIDFLKELGRPDVIPKEALEADFKAMAEFSLWLQHPFELNAPPDELEIIDKRMLPWPPERNVKPFWIIKYILRDKTREGKDDVNYGLVGSDIFCFFSKNMPLRPPEDVYAIHCYWEMENQGLITEVELFSSGKSNEVQKEWKGEAVEDYEIIRAVNISPELKYPRKKIVAIAKASISGNSGFMVLDGEGSVWHPESEMLESELPDTVLEIHVGRRLLGFN